MHKEKKKRLLGGYLEQCIRQLAFTAFTISIHQVFFSFSKLLNANLQSRQYCFCQEGLSLLFCQMQPGLFRVENSSQKSIYETRQGQSSTFYATVVDAKKTSQFLKYCLKNKNNRFPSLYLHYVCQSALMCLALTGTRSSNFFYHPLAKSLTFRVSRSEGRFRRRSRAADFFVSVHKRSSWMVRV